VVSGESMKNIILCGFMGCGKSTVGKALAQISGKVFVDMDSLIEKEQNMRIPEIFEKYGENYFRELEHKTCIDLSQKRDLVIASGGGTLISQRNADILAQTGIIVFLEVPLKEISLRLKNDTSRPLLNTSNREQVMAGLFNFRIPLYKKNAEFIVNGANSPYNIAREIDIKSKKG